MKNVNFCKLWQFNKNWQMDEISKDLAYVKDILSSGDKQQIEIFGEISDIEPFGTFDEFQQFFVSELISFLPFTGNKTRQIYDVIKKHKLSEESIQCFASVIHQIDDSFVQKEAFLSIIKTFNEKEMKEFISTFVNITIATFNHSPQLCMKHKPGLKNLGAICYMNSIIQQLYSLSDFLGLFLTIDFSLIPGYTQLQNIFYKMNRTVLPFISLEEFTSSWLGRGNKKIKVKEQQDAFEFLQLLIDRSCSPGVQSLFSSTVTSIIENQEIGLRKEITQNYIGLSLQVKYNKTLDQALSSYIEPELLCDENQYYCEEVGNYIVAQKTNIIKSFAPILVFQLQRFEYNIAKNKEIKINDPFEFPETIDLQKYQSGSTAPIKYNLHGVVIHSGTGSSGHYISIIKQNGKWYKYNDHLVTIISQDQFKALAIGDVKGKISAYLLIYTSDDLKECDPFNSCPAAIKHTIETENSEYYKYIFAFSEPFMTYMVKEANDDLFYVYFFNIFIHAAKNFKLCPLALSRVLKSNPNFVAVIFNQYFTVASNAILLGNEEVKKMLSDIISTASIKATTDEGKKLIKLLIAFLPNTLQMAKNIIYPSAPIYKFISSSTSETIEILHATGWLNDIVKVLELIFSSKKSDAFLKVVDASNLINCIPILFVSTKEDAKIIEKLSKLVPYVKKAPHSLPAFTKALQTIQNKTNVAPVVKKEVPSPVPQVSKEQLHKEKIKEILNAKNDEEMKKLMLNCTMTEYEKLVAMEKETDKYHVIAQHADILVIDSLSSINSFQRDEAIKLCMLLPQKELAFSFMNVLAAERNVVLMKDNNSFFSVFDTALKNSGLNQEEKYPQIIEFLKSIVNEQPSQKLFTALNVLLFFDKEKEADELLSNFTNVQKCGKDEYIDTMQFILLKDRKKAFDIIFEPPSFENLWRLSLNAQILKGIELSDDENSMGITWIFSAISYYFNSNELFDDSDSDSSDDFETEKDIQIQLVDKLIPLLTLFNADKYDTSRINVKQCINFFTDLFEEKQYIPYMKFFSQFNNIMEQAAKERDSLCKCLVLFKDLENETSVEKAVQFLEKYSNDNDCQVFIVLYYYAQNNAEFLKELTKITFVNANLKKPGEKVFYVAGFGKISNEERISLFEKVIELCNSSEHKTFKRNIKKILLINKYYHIQLTKDLLSFTKDDLDFLDESDANTLLSYFV